MNSIKSTLTSLLMKPTYKMGISEEYKSTKFIKPLSALTFWLAISPKFNFKTNKLDKITPFRILSAVFLFLLAISITRSTYGRFQLFYPFIPALDAGVDFLKLLSLALVTFFNQINVSFRCTKSYAVFLRKLTSLEKQLPSFPCSGRLAKFEILLQHLYVFSLIALDCYNMETKYPGSIAIYAVEDFLYYHVIVSVYFISCNIRLIKGKFEALNTIFEEINKNVGKLSAKNSKGSLRIFARVKRAHLILDELLSIVELFNGIFGWNILFVAGNVFLSLLCSSQPFTSKFDLDVFFWIVFNGWSVVFLVSFFVFLVSFFLFHLYS